VSSASGTIERRKLQTRNDQNFSLTTTATTADQSIGTDTPPANTKYYIQAIIIEVTFTTISTTAAHFGTITVRWGTTAIVGPIQASNPSSGAPFGFVVSIPDTMTFEGDGSTTINAICTPASVTSMVWKVSIIGFEESF
jgi:hypothetical protein